MRTAGSSSSRSMVLVFLLIVVSSLTISPQVSAPLTSVTVAPTSQVVSQGSLATYAVSISSTSPAGTTYALSLSGLALGANYGFSPPSVSISVAGTGSSTLAIDAASTPIYCPGTYGFTVRATATGAPADTLTSAITTLTVIQVGPPLQVGVSTDKQAYKIGETVTIRISLNRPARGTLTISPPTGSPSTFPYVAYGPTYTITRTLIASQPHGEWTVTFQADDFCSGFNSGVAYFKVSPDTYDVSVSLSGLPSQVSVRLQVDGQNEGTMGSSEIKTLTFRVETSHTVAVDQYVQGEPGVRYFTPQNTWTVGSAGSHTVDYETQFLFAVSTDPEGIAQVTGGGWFRAGTVVQTGAPPMNLTGPPGTQFVFKGWEVDGVLQSGNSVSMALDKRHTAIAKYEPWYLLTIDSAYGNSRGQGWYSAGSTARFSVTSPYGFLIQQVFVRWTGDYSGTSPEGSIAMDGPKTIHAEWTTSYLQLILVLIAAVVIVGVVLMRRRRKPSEPIKKPTPRTQKSVKLTPGAAKCPTCGTEVPSGQDSCQNCGTKIT